ncbi:exonuclease, phage-type [Pseudomonas protegens]|nr:exonuclease, phage-type [Pseudomonas protegens]GED73331.1 hypothetical protein PFL02_01810 [Pseudomonas fluorescens]
MPNRTGLVASIDALETKKPRQMPRLYSPDALVGDKGLTEIKTKLPKFQVSVILAGEVPKEHVAQC